VHQKQFDGATFQFKIEENFEFGYFLLLFFYRLFLLLCRFGIIGSHSKVFTMLMHSNPQFSIGNFHDFKTLFAFANFNNGFVPTFLSS
jgi:hypothetical protein